MPRVSFSLAPGELTHIIAITNLLALLRLLFDERVL
jgi:hypothetical protein